MKKLLTVLNYVAKDLSEFSAKLKEAVQTAQPPAEASAEKPVEKSSALRKSS